MNQKIKRPLICFLLVCLSGLTWAENKSRIIELSGNPTSPIVAGGKASIYKSKHHLDSMVVWMKKIQFYDDFLAHVADSLIDAGELRTELDLMSLIPGTSTLYYGHDGKHGKKRLLDICERVAKHPVFNDIDSIYLEYFRDTLVGIKHVRHYSGYSLCFRDTNGIIVKERLEIAISNSGNFYKKHFNREMPLNVQQAFNHYLSNKNVQERLSSFSLGLIFLPDHSIHNLRGVCFKVMGKAYFNILPGLRLKSNVPDFGYTGYPVDFSGFNSREYKSRLNRVLDSSGLISHFTPATQRSIKRIVSENSFDGLHEIISKFNLGETVMMQWGEYPDVHKSNLKDIANISRGKVLIENIWDNYATSTTDSFSVSFRMNAQAYQSTFYKHHQPNLPLYMFVAECVEEQLVDERLYIGKLPKINNWVIFLLDKNQLEALKSVGFTAIL